MRAMLTDSLFELDPAATGSGLPGTLYAEIVFDRPLDQAYSYRVPDDQRERIAIGKRVEAPFGRGDSGTVGYCVRLTEEKPTRTVKSIARILDDEVLLTDPILRLTRWMADYYLCGWGQVLQAVLPAGVRDKAGTREVVFVEAVPESELPETRWELTTKQSAALDKLRREGEPMEQRRLAKLAQVSTGVIAALIDKGYIRKFHERVERLEIPDDSPLPLQQRLELNAEQATVFKPVDLAVREGTYKSFLLRGVTGSGKTEVYLRAIEETIKLGREAIVLVPEISLTPQTIERFRGRCGNVAVLHSHMTDSERGAHWRRVAAGQVDVVVGARSAIFAPTRKLGLIVIDEEHESSFKQESTPRYHARDVAVMRAKIENIPILMGSATPSLESWHNAHKGNYTLLSLPNRVMERPLPLVRTIDLRHEPKRGGIYHAISPTLEDAMQRVLGKGEQVMLLLNRRGFSTHVHCAGCGYVATCKHCDLAMTFHRARNSLLCHYCGFEQEPYEKCPVCTQPAVRYQGLGTEKLQAELLQKFPGKVVQRMDSDTMTRPGSHQKVLDAFREGSVQILLGTQMIAKGLDFPNVTLVGVINADVGLHLPDFRATERSFQLLAQVAGRTGRGPRGGQVMIQSYTPEHPCILLATKHDYLSFARTEMEARKAHRYPPFQRLARVIIRSLREEAVSAFADQMAEAFTKSTTRPERMPPRGAGVRVLGPAECPVYRLNDYYRFHFQLQSASPALLHEVLREVMATVKPPHAVEYQVDIDPYNLM